MARLSDYSILRELGQGGYAVVYLAEEVATKRLVTLKQISIERESTAVLEYDILRKAGCGKGIICYRALFIERLEDGRKYVFIVADYYEGRDVFTFITEGDRLSPPETIYICRRLLKALKWLHEHGIVHRDIKPENILITNTGPVIIDFGLACQMKNAHQVVYTCDKRVGTIESMAPELEYISLCLSRKEKNPFPDDIYAKADIWALGLVFKSLVESDIFQVEPEPHCDIYKGWSKWLAAWTSKNLQLFTVNDYEDIPVVQYSLRRAIEGMLKPDYTKRMPIEEALDLLDQAEKQLSD